MQTRIKSKCILFLQFVSPHTGLVYQKHITGLCQFMQDEVELEVRRAQAFGKFLLRGFLISAEPISNIVFLESFFDCEGGWVNLCKS